MASHVASEITFWIVATLRELKQLKLSDGKPALVWSRLLPRTLIIFEVMALETAPTFMGGPVVRYHAPE